MRKKKMKDVLHESRKLFFVPLLTLALCGGPGFARAQAEQQQSFASPWQALHALVAAVKSDNQTELMKIFGPEGNTLVSSGDPEQDARDRQTFLQKYEQSHRLVKEMSGDVVLYIGSENWPFPIPLTESNGRWTFDTGVGKQQILLRRIGKNELSAVEVCHELVAAEKEHYAGAHPGEAGQYAPNFTATAGEHDGLYHPVTNGQPEIGPLLAKAAAEGSGEHTPFHGYFFRILDKQGPDAPGGAKNYIVDGKMTGGFAFVAYPAEYKSTGVMTFIVNQDGTVYEKDLGPSTSDAAKHMQEFNPDSSWVKVDE
jgi:Protein of unknown function (DUF2950)